MQSVLSPFCGQSAGNTALCCVAFWPGGCGSGLFGDSPSAALDEAEHPAPAEGYLPAPLPMSENKFFHRVFGDIGEPGGLGQFAVNYRYVCGRDHLLR